MKKAVRAIKNNRRAICALAGIAAFVVLVGITGTCENGNMRISEYLIKAVLCFAAMVAAAIIGAERE